MISDATRRLRGSSRSNCTISDVTVLSPHPETLQGKLDCFETDHHSASMATFLSNLLNDSRLSRPIYIFGSSIFVTGITKLSVWRWLFHRTRCKSEQVGSDMRIEPELIQPKRRSFHSPLTAFRWTNHTSDEQGLRSRYIPSCFSRRHCCGPSRTLATRRGLNICT